MIAFAPFPTAQDQDSVAYDSTRHPDILDDDEDYMNLDFEDEDCTSGSKLTCPGESITSSHAFMRFVKLVRLVAILTCS